MNDLRIISQSPKETTALGKRLSQHLKKGTIVCLSGDLGAGKTTFVKGMAQGLKLSALDVNSPTFVIMNTYEGKLPLYHFDLYRIEHEQEIGIIGYEEFLYGEGIAVIEWAEKMGKLIPKEYLEIKIAHKKNSQRSIQLKAHGASYDKLLKGLKI